MSSAAASSFPAGTARGRSSRPDSRSSSMHRRQPASWALVLAVFVCFVSHALAAAIPEPAVPADTLGDQTSPFQEGQIWAKVQKRATTDAPESTKSSSTSASKTSSQASVTATFSVGVGSSKSSTSSSSSSTTSAAPSPLPSILDSMANNFSPGPNGESPPCPIFINSFLQDPTFQACYPLSMLFNSKSFFEAQKSLVSITRTLDATCAANQTTCTTYLTQLAKNFTSTANCGTDYARGEASVVDAYDAMVAYAPVYTAGCLKDADTGAYCYASAVTNLTNPSTTYFYFLPLNKTLPASAAPACNACLKGTMGGYQAATADRRQMIANTYSAAAKQVNVICGPGFVNETLVAEVIPSGAVGLGVAGSWLVAALPVLVAVVLGVV